MYDRVGKPISGSNLWPRTEIEKLLSTKRLVVPGRPKKARSKAPNEGRTKGQIRVSYAS